MKRIYIYKDTGTSLLYYMKLNNALNRILPQHTTYPTSVCALSARQIKDSYLPTTNSTLIIPGGKSSYYSTALGCSGIRKNTRLCV